MPITILDYVKTVVGEKETYTANDFASAGVEMIGGCEICSATLGPYNAYPARSGYWRCADCIGDTGFATAEEFVKDEAESDRAVDWLLRLRQLQADGMSFDAALAQANAEAESEPVIYVFDPKAAGLTSSTATSDDHWINCPACGEIENIGEIRGGDFECGECGAEWTL